MDEFDPWASWPAAYDATLPMMDPESLLPLPPLSELQCLPPVDTNAFKGGMRLLAAGCSVLAAEHDGDRAGLTATAVCSITADPPRLLICVNRNVHAHNLIAASRAVSVNVISRAQEQVAKRFAGMVEGVFGAERFANGAWTRGRSGAPLLIDSLASFDCRVVEHLPASSHGVFICEVLEVRTAPCPSGPLVYYDGRFDNLAGCAAAA